MDEQVRPDEAAQALDEIRRRQEQVIDTASIPAWYWWAVGGLMVVLAAGVDIRRPAAIGVAVTVFVTGLLAATGRVVFRSLRTRVRNEFRGPRAVVAILSFEAGRIGS